MKNLREQIDEIFVKKDNEELIKTSLANFYKTVLKRVYEKCYSSNLDFPSITVEVIKEEDDEAYLIAEMIYKKLPELEPYLSKINESLGIKNINVNRIAEREEFISNIFPNQTLNLSLLAAYANQHSFSINIEWDYNKMKDSGNAYIRNMQDVYTKWQVYSKDLSTTFDNLKRYIENIMLFLANNDKIKVTLTSTKKILSIDAFIVNSSDEIKEIMDTLSMEDIEYNSSYKDLINYFSSMGFYIGSLSEHVEFKIPDNSIVLEVSDSSVNIKPLTVSDMGVNKGIHLTISWEENIEVDLRKFDNYYVNVAKTFDVENRPEEICKDIIADINTI